MSFLPSSLFGRLLASLLVAVGITLAVIVLLIVQDRRELTMRVGGVGDTARRIAEITVALEKLDRAARATERRRLSADPTLMMEPERHDRGPPRREELPEIARAFASQLREHLGRGYRISVAPAQRSAADVIRLVAERGAPPRRADREMHEPPPMDGLPPPMGAPHDRGQVHRPGAGALDVSVTLPDGDSLVFRVAVPRREPPVPWQLFVQLGVLTIVLVIVLYVVTRNITRPLSNLARAADAVGRSIRHPPLAEEGVREIREATRAFNTMQDRLLRYLDSRTSVLAAMSHDLRTPLTRLRLRVESVSDAQLRTRFRSDLDEMESLVRGALALFKGLDDDEASEPVDVNALLGTLATEYAEVGSSVAVEGTARQDFEAKPRALKRCLTNLVDNALKFGTRARIRVDDGEALVIRISDDGPGIPEESLERVFEPFYRLESSRSRDTGGTGLGLSIARDIAQAHGGTLTLGNRPEGGLTAELRLPRRR